MSIRPYSGETFVAYLDISGFKKMMEKGKAERALNRFYSTIYSVGKSFRNLSSQEDLLEVNAIVVSDCAVIFSRNTNPANAGARIIDMVKGLRSILKFIRKINRRLITSRSRRRSERIMTTCSIAYGDFKYEDRIEFFHVRKNFFLGPSYVKAFLDNENGSPKIRPGQCRLLKKDLNLPSDLPGDHSLSLLKRKHARKHYYFHWMLPNLEHLKKFNEDYADAYRLKGSRRYDEVATVLQKYSNTRQ